jgi:nitrogen fixation/metabolism regulation signal transduction histidine kinase
VNRLRNKLILIFVAATLVPLAATAWLTTALLRRSVDFSSTSELDVVSQSLQQTGKELYRHACDDLRLRAESGHAKPVEFPLSDEANWPEVVKSFAAGQEAERFVLAGDQGNRLDYLTRGNGAILVYWESLGDVGLDRVKKQILDARDAVEWAHGHDLRRGLALVYFLLAAVFWLGSLALMIYLAHRISQPIQQLTAGLSQLSAGDLNARVPLYGEDETGNAIRAFNNMAARLQESTERLVYLRQLSSWQTLARKTAHEIKNSLTPIRLTVEEMVARHADADPDFLQQAAQIVVEEVESLERRVRAFSQFAAEPPVCPKPVDVNSLLQERIAFLKSAHPEVAYDTRLADHPPQVVADQDLLRGILTNLLENAAEAAGEGGRILGVTAAESGRVAIEVHDSGPGLSGDARASLFQPTISFKKKGMGLGLSIARKSALLSGGDIVVTKGELGGAGFRVLLPVATNGIQAPSDRG